MSRPATIAELNTALTLIELVNGNLRLLNQAMLGEKADGPEDRFGQVGEAVAKHCEEAATLLGKLQVELARSDADRG